jgi:uncharacterized RDD family membrane protein YckC
LRAHAWRSIVKNAAVSELPSYPREAAEREAAAITERSGHDLAGWWSRVGAYLIDTIILLVPLGAIFVAVLASSPDDDSGAWAVLALAYLLSIVLPFVYFTAMHGGARGQTFGKRAVGIRVVNEAGGSIGYGRAFGRYALTFVFGLLTLPVLLDYLWPLWDGKNQALHDKAVGSLVVRA